MRVLKLFAMDQRLTSKRWLLALSALLLFAIVVLLMPRQPSEDDTTKPVARRNQTSSTFEQGTLVDAAEETHQLRKLRELGGALAIKPALPPAGPDQVTSIAATEQSATIEVSERFSAVHLSPQVTERQHTEPNVLDAENATLQPAIFEEVMDEPQSFKLTFTHRNASFDSRLDASPNDAAVQLTEWRRLLGVQVPPSLPAPISQEIASPEAVESVDEDFKEQVELTNEDIFSPLVIAPVPNQEQYIRETANDGEKISIALAPIAHSEIVDEEGYWEPLATKGSSLQVLSPLENAPSTISGNDSFDDNADEIERKAPWEVRNSATPYEPMSDVASLDIQSDPAPGKWQMRSAIRESASVSNQLVLPAATPVFPQNTQASADKSPEQEKKTDETKPRNTEQEQEQQTAANDDKKMIGHLAGKFGTCFRSAISCGLYFGNEFTFLAAEPPGTTRVRVIDTISSQMDQYSSEDAFGFGNRLTLGIQSQNTGFRLVYWTYAGGYSGHDAWKDLEDSPVFSTTSKIGLETLDIDLTQKYCFLGCNLMTACGVRFAEYQGSEFTNVSSNLQGALETSGSTRSFRSMKGLGPTVFMELRKTIPWCLGSPARMPYGMIDPGSTGCFGCCQSDCGTYGNCGGCGGCDSCNLGSPCFPWRFYANFRVSALWADTYSESMTESVVATGDGIVTQGIARGRDKASLNQDDENSLLATQIQFGLEHRTPILCNRALWICRLGLEIQSWDTGKHESKSQSYAFLADPDDEFGGRVETLARADNRYLDLFGFTFLLGLNY